MFVAALGIESFALQTARLLVSAATRPRGVLTNLVEWNGGRVLGTVTKELQYLVIADPQSTSSKTVKARQYGTKLITEEDFIALLREKGVDAQ